MSRNEMEKLLRELESERAEHMRNMNTQGVRSTGDRIRELKQKLEK